MERPTRLADLKLVNKYYPPVGTANYSYPKHKQDSTSPCERTVGRSSVGSEASVPDMMDDRESIISTDEDDKSFYYVSGADLWDKFWEDPFWEANAIEAERDADGISQRTLNRNTIYPALIPSPDEARQKDQYFLHYATSSVVPESEPSSKWPLAVAKPPASPRPATPKVSYSLFPRQSPTPPSVLNLSPRKPGLTPRTTSLWGRPDFNDSSASLNSLGRSSIVRKTRSDIPLSKDRSSWTPSAAAVPVVMIPSPPPPLPLPTQRHSSQSINLKHRFPVRPTRTRSDTLASPSSITSAPRSLSNDISRQDVTVAFALDSSRPATKPPMTTHSLQRVRGRYSQPEARKLPPPLQLHRCTTETELPSSHQCQSRVVSHVYAHTNPCTPVMPTHPEPAPVSFFEVDSDSDEEETSFARRIARSFTSQVRTRSASAAPRSRKGQEVAKNQLRRARAETVGSPPPEVEVQEITSAQVDDKADRDLRPPMLRKQKSEVFKKIFWNRR
ncbi:unnamed protein product [Discula destructiva]